MQNASNITNKFGRFKGSPARCRVFGRCHPETPVDAAREEISVFCIDNLNLDQGGWIEPLGVRPKRPVAGLGRSRIIPFFKPSKNNHIGI